MMTFHIEGFITKIWFHQNGQTVRQLSSSHLGQKNHGRMMIIALEQFDSILNMLHCINKEAV